MDQIPLDSVVNLNVASSSDRGACASKPSPALLNALTLTERRRVLTHSRESLTSDASRAERLFSRWCAQAPFESEDLLRQRVASDELNIDEFKWILGIPTEDLQAHESHFTWMRLLDEALAYATDEKSREHLPGPTTDDPAMHLLNPLRVLVCPAYERLVAGFERVTHLYPQTRFDPNGLAAAWFANLYSDLYGMVGRTFVLELHVAGTERRLRGRSPRRRFESFCHQLSKPRLLRDLFHEYPVLARQLISRIWQWVDFGLEFIERLSDDMPQLCNRLGLTKELGPVVDLNARAGDSHRGGRRVVIVKFLSGAKLVYKPRALAVDVHFQQLIQWFNDRGDHPPLRMLRVVDRGHYGWHEFVSEETCHSEEHVTRFYQRQGAFIALLYVLQATDFHSENVIAAGEHPILVDLESLLMPRLDIFGSASGVDGRLGEAFGYSVLRPGLLPQGLSFDGAQEGIDISGLGTVAGQFSPYRVPYFEDAGTDRMRLKRERLEMRAHKNRPTLAGRQVDLLNYREALNAGFRSAYFTLLQHRDELTAADGPLARFAHDEVRPILRVSQNYAFLLEESFHPDLMRDALERDRFFDRLWIQSASGRRIPEIIKAERDDLLNGDLPKFTTRPYSTDIWTSSGDQIANFFKESGLEAARKCLGGLGEEDFDRQFWLLNASLATTVKAPAAGDLPPATKLKSSLPTYGSTLVDTARAIGDRLAQLALYDRNEASWLGLVLVGERHTGVRPLQNDMYDGLPGVTLFLAYLGRMTGDARYIKLAERSFHVMLRYRAGRGSLNGSIGGFDGWGGFIYVLTHLGSLWERPDLLMEAQKVAQLLPSLIHESRIDGVLGGTAGCLASLLALYRITGSAQVLAIARMCGDRLIGRSTPLASGSGWTLKENSPPLCGFAHGAAGIAWALFSLATLTGETRYRSTAIQGIQYERSLFSLKERNWPDLRPEPPEVKTDSMLAWCHGAPGIGLGRLVSPLHRDPETRREIEMAVDTTLCQGFGDNHSLCHGDLGNLELILRASEVLKDTHLSSKVDEIATAVLDDIRTNGWRCGVALNVEHPGLMTGLAGIGYGLLRLSNPSVVPSVLTLEGPAVVSRTGGFG